MTAVTLAPGARLGPYEIVASLGRGGMGEVYQAHDTRLDRTVAIKIMGGAITAIDTGDGLEREARAIAALNHPHICALHDVGREHNTPFLIMEYVKGETLAERLARGPIPTRELLRIAIQIGEALDHAHRNGVVHRDLKPANVMLTKSGVKVLDFGLATLRAAAPLHIPLEGTPIVTHPLASDRTLLGTIHYMAPERLEDADAGPASDLFSLGAVMYEMATGRRPFESGSPAGVIAAVLHADPPPPSTIRADVPPALDWTIEKALAKKPDARWRAAGDIVEVLRWIARNPERAQPAGNAAAAASAAPPRRRLAPTAAAAIVMLILAAGLFLALARGFGPAPVGTPTLTFSILPPSGGGFTPTPSSVATSQFALSPDGRRLAYVAAIEHDLPQLWVRPLDSLNAEPVTGTHDAEYPFWSPDSASVGFFANGLLKRVDLAGGPPRVLAAAPHGRGGAWNRNGVIIFGPDTQTALYRVPAAGGEVTSLTHVDAARHEASHRWPQFLGDDHHFLYFVQTTAPEPSHAVFLGDLDGSAPRKVLASPLSASYAPPDRLLFMADDALNVARFDVAAARIVGERSAIVASVAGSSNFHAAFSASDNGLLAYVSAAASAELVWYDHRGGRTGAVGPSAEYVDFRLSPDDQQLALAEVDPQSHRPDIRVLDLVRGAKLRLTSEAATDASPVWSPDGRQIVFRSNPNGLHDLYVKAANGGARSVPLLRTQNGKYPTDWTPDGRSIVYTDQHENGSDIWLVAVDGSGTTPLVQTPFSEVQGQISPDGRWVAYTSLETDRPEVYIRSFSDLSTRWQVSAGGGTDPRWRRDTRELFFISADSWLMSVGFANAHPAVPRRLFEVHIAPPGDPFLSNYDVTADGERFLIKVPTHDVTSTPIHVLSNWPNARRGS